MNGKSYSLPLGMVFKKYYCAKCGAKLEKEKTHRVVTKDDKDYYQYHDFGRFPRRNYDVYDYRFMCPACGVRTSFDEQCIIDRIQKKHGHSVLSSSEIKSNYKESREGNHKRVLLGRVLVSIVLVLIGFVLFCISGWDGTKKDLMSAAIFFFLSAAVNVVGAIRRYKGNYRMKIRYAYSYEKEAQLEKLHTYSSHNRKLIVVANKCYCFCCKATIDSHEIKDFTDDGQTAICPQCGTASILPDSIEGGVDDKTISEMNAYWY